MKTCVEFGLKDGVFSPSNILPTIKLGQKLAAELVWVLSQGKESHASDEHYWAVSKAIPRIEWQSDTHFVILSVLDGEPRGPGYPKVITAYK